jgi:hypothetical protein
MKRTAFCTYARRSCHSESERSPWNESPLRDEIAGLADLFDLEPQEENAAHLISGQMSALWAALEDMRSK